VRKLRFAAVFLVTILGFGQSAEAGVMTVSGPNVTQGELYVESGNGYQRDDGTNAYEHGIEVGYSLTNYWKTALEGMGERAGGDNLRYGTTTLKNTFQFLRQEGASPIAAAFRIDYTHAHLGGEADDVETRLLLQRSQGDWAAIVNIGFDKQVGKNSDDDVGANLRGKLRYKLNDWAMPALEYFGSFGAVDDMQGFEKQNHKIGPAVEFALTKNTSVEIGYAVGISENAPDHSFKLNIGYGF